MNGDLSEALLLEAMKSELGPGTSVAPAQIPPGSLWDRALSHVEGWTRQRVTLYGATGGLPEIFCMDSDDAPAVVVSAEYLEYLAKFRRVVTDPTLGPARTDVIEQLFLETAAFHCLKRGDPDIGALLYQRAMHKRRYLVDVTHLFDPLLDEADPCGKSLIEGLYSVVHEIGHTNRDTASLVMDVSPITDSSLMQRMEKILGEVTWMTEDIRGYVRKIAKGRRKSHILGLDNIRREGYADIFAGQRLFSLAATIARQQRIEFDPVAFIAALHNEANIVGIMQRARLVAGMTSDFPFGTEDTLDVLLFPVAIGLRLHLLLVGLFGFARQFIPADSQLAEEGVFLNGILEAIAPRASPTMDDCDEGVDRAINALAPDLVLDEAASLALTRAVLGRSRYAQLDAGRFLFKAEQFGIHTPSMEAFRAVVMDPELRESESRDHRTYYIILAENRVEKYGRIFTLPLVGKPPAVCAFTTEEFAELLTDDFGSSYLQPGESFALAQMDVQHVAQLDALIRKQMGKPITLLVEGTQAYDDFLVALKVKQSGGNVAQEDAEDEVRRRTAEAMAGRYQLYCESTDSPATLEQFTQIIRILEDD